jgi:hypothetical protein
VAASDEIRGLMVEWSRKQANFYNDVWYLRTIQQDEQRGVGLKPSVVKERYGVRSLEQWQKIDATRKVPAPMRPLAPPTSAARERRTRAAPRVPRRCPNSFVANLIEHEHR